MTKNQDIKIINNLPKITIWGDNFEDFSIIKFFKGKFVVTDDGKLIIKIIPKKEYDKSILYHNTMLEDLGITNSTSPDMYKKIVGGGKVEVKMIGEYVECRLYGKSTTYGYYDKKNINKVDIENAIRDIFEIIEIPVLVIKK